MEPHLAPPALPAPPSYKLFSPGQILLAAFLGTPLPGMWMLSANLKRMGRAQEATSTLVLGAVLTVVTFAIAFVVPEQVPPLATSLPGLVVVFQIARTRLAEPLKQHAAAGGQIDSWGKAVGFGLAGLIIALALIVCVVMMLPE